MKLKINNIGKIISALFISVISFILCFLILQTKPLIILQNSIIDSVILLRNKHFNYNNKPIDDVFFVNIDETSINDFLEKRIIKWPWPREIYGYVSSHLIDEGAKAIIFDINFAAPDMDHYGAPGYGEINDNRFYNVIFNTNKIIIPFEINMDSENDTILDTLKAANYSNFKNVKEYKSIIPPCEPYTIGNDKLGFNTLKTDIDNSTRNYIPFVKIKNKNYPSLAAAAYLFTIDNKFPDSLQLNKNGNFKINWYVQKDNKKPFKSISFSSVYTDYINKKTGIPLEIPQDTFKDKIVFIGITANGLLYTKNSPYSYHNKYPEVEIHATAYLNLKNNEWIKDLPYYFELPIYFIFIFLLILLGLNLKSKTKFIVIYFTIIILLFLSHFLIFYYLNMISNTILFIIIFALLANFFEEILYNVAIGNNKVKNKKASAVSFEPKQSNKKKIKIKKIKKSKLSSTKGEQLTASVLFIEIVNFSTYSKNNSAEKVIETLNIYYDNFAEIIKNNNGIINNISENGITALFGAPIKIDDHADMAVKSAFECYHSCKELHKTYGIDLQIGINSGEITIGGLNALKSNNDYIAVGDCINFTEIIKDTNKIFETSILIGEETKNLLNDVYDLQYLGEFNFKEQNELYKIFYFFETKKQHKERFKLMANAYENNDINSFKRFISYFLENDANFGPALFYIRHFKNNEKNFGKPINLSEIKF